MTSSSRAMWNNRPVGGRDLAPITKRLIALAPGKRIEITAPDGDLAAERKRMASRIRTARLSTGRRYRVETHNGKLFVYCEQEQDAS